MQTTKAERHELRSEEHVVLFRQLVRRWAAELSFSLVDQTKIVTAASEIGRNTLVHGGGGTAEIQIVRDGDRRGLKIVFEDTGRGIADTALAMRDGYTTGNGLGLGLGGAKRLVSEFELASKPGAGTRVTLIRWK